MSDVLCIGIRCEGPDKLTSLVGECVRSHALAFCDVSAFGELKWIEIVEESMGGSKRLNGPFQLLSLRGRLRLVGDISMSDFVCTVARQTDSGIQVLGGVLLEAEVGYLELTLIPLVASEIEGEVFETQAYAKPVLGLEKEVVAETQSQGAQEKEEADSRLPMTADLDERWSQAVVESQRIRNMSKVGDERQTSDDRPELGDVVIHRQFGKCKVIRVGDSHITLRKPDSRNVQLGLAILNFYREEDDDDGKAVFSVSVRPRR